MTAKSVVLQFWEIMNTNDFAAAGELLADNFTCFWPQSSELITGREAFTQINSRYPAAGKWRFTLNASVCEHNKVVTDVSVTDGATVGRAITFHTVEHGKIVNQVEFWPEPFAAPDWRKDWISLLPTD